MRRGERACGRSRVEQRVVERWISGDDEYVRLRSSLIARRRRMAGKGASRAREINDRLEKQGRFFDDSTEIVRADREAGWQ